MIISTLSPNKFRKPIKVFYKLNKIFGERLNGIMGLSLNAMKCCIMHIP